MKNNKEAAMAAVKQDGKAPEHASKKMNDDEEAVMRVLKQNVDVWEKNI